MEPFQMYCIEISGTPRQRGQSHGEQMRPQIRALFEQGRQELEQAGGPALERMAAAFLEKTGHLQAARQWAPDLVEELHGIAEAAGVDFGVLWVFQCQDEMYWFNTGQLGSLQAGVVPEHCSSLGLPACANRPALLAQNLDTPTLYNGYQTLLHIHYPEPSRQAYVVTEPGLVGICGLNSSPLGVCQNTLAIRLNYDPNGLPAMLVARSLIDQPDLDTALHFLQEVPHASGINYMLADSSRVLDYECSSGQVTRYLPTEAGEMVIHTNHPLANTDRIDPQKFSQDFQQLYSNSNTHSANRLGCLVNHFKDRQAPVGVEDIQQALASHEPAEFPVCRHRIPDGDPYRSMTNNSLVMRMGQPAQLHLTSGPPCLTEYRLFSFS